MTHKQFLKPATTCHITKNGAIREHVKKERSELKRQMSTQALVFTFNSADLT